MSELRELYQEIIIDHGRNPRNFGVLPMANYTKEGFNPLCGDKVTLYIHESAGMIKNICFEGCGCAISMASASLMAESLKGKTIAYAAELFELFRRLITEDSVDDATKEKLGKLAVLGGVSEFPARVKCAALAWHTLRALLLNDDASITTE
jgi:nitrogen fixation NifU-like protein